MVEGCPDADLLATLVAGTISEQARSQVANHAASCETCHELISGLVDVGSGGRDPTLPVDDLAEPLVLDRGAKLGRYVIDGRLGAGGMGVVYSAVDSELERRVAVKLLRPDHDGAVAGTAGRERLMREARTLARLSHPNVVTVFDVGTHRDHQFVAMELVDGGSLTAWLERAPRTSDDIIDRMLEAGRGLAAAHSAGVVHRDVKPDNILVGPDGRARVTDFGLARQGELTTPSAVSSLSSSSWNHVSLTQTGALVGTPAYMAPEQAVHADVLTDQWSFCATLYEALANVRPFPVDITRIPAIAAQRFATPKRSLPSWIRPIIARGLHADPASRWPSMDALVAAIVRRRHRRRNVAIGALAVALVAIAIAIPVARRKYAKPTVRPTVSWKDFRAGCSCPFSSCKNGCVSICNAPAFVIGAKVPGVNSPTSQDVLLGVTGDGNTILYLTGEGCTKSHLMLARRRGDTFVPVDITDQVDTKRIEIFEGCCSISHDGATLVFPTIKRAGLIEARLDGKRFTLADAELAGVLPKPAAELQPFSIVHPFYSADGRSLYFRLFQMFETDYGPYDGQYVVERPDVKSAFANPKRIRAARMYEYATGVSSDGLSLFMDASFESNVLVRSSTKEPFGDPGFTLKPARLPGFRAIPTADCRQILTTMTPGGCAGEDITYLDAAKN